MDCKDIKNVIDDYFEDNLNHWELDKFVKHFEKGCKECREELELSYIIKYGLSKDYEKKGGSYNFVKVISEGLAETRKKVDIVKKRNKISNCLLAGMDAFLLACAIYFFYYIGMGF